MIRHFRGAKQNSRLAAGPNRVARKKLCFSKGFRRKCARELLDSSQGRAVMNTTTASRLPPARRSSGIGAVLIMTAATLMPGASQVARFGVGPRPAGYFVLVGADYEGMPPNPLPVNNQSFGDNRHKITFYIEVTGEPLVVNIYDPGLYDPLRDTPSWPPDPTRDSIR